MKKTWFLIGTILLVTSCTVMLPSNVSSSSELVSSSSLSESSSISSSSSSSVTSVLSETDMRVMIDVFSMNDFHGAVAENINNNEPGLARIGAFFNQKKLANPNRVSILSAGDFWQGSADSNITRGRLVTEGMNLIGFEAMAIGNHEFDWGDTIIASNADLAAFPLLAANIIDKQTGQRASFAQPYVLLEKAGVDIGIIGTIGANLESSILASAVMNYEFVPYTQLVNEYAQTLRNQGADIIILLNHDGSVESGVLPNVDAVFNGHTHRVESAMIQSTPVMQAGAYGRAVAQVQFEYNLLSHSIISSTMTMHQNLTTLIPDAALNELYQTYLVNEINEIKNEVVGIANGNFNTSTLARLAVNEMLSFGLLYNAKVAFHNAGGVRASIASGTVTYGDIYRAFPFDNELMIVEVTGAELKTWLSYNLVSYGVLSNGTQFIDGTMIVNTTLYKIISINYLTEKHWVSDDYPHNVDTAINSFEYVRELIKQAWQIYGTLNASDY